MSADGAAVGLRGARPRPRAASQSRARSSARTRSRHASSSLRRSGSSFLWRVCSTACCIRSDV